MEGVTEDDRARGVPLAASKLSVDTSSSSGRCADEDAKELRAQKAGGAELGEELLSCAASSSTCAWRRRTGQAAKPDQFGKVRRNIARVKTVQARAQPVTQAKGVRSNEPADHPRRRARAAARQGAQHTLTGRVVSTKMQKTIAVSVERLVKHPQYGKYVRRTTKLLAHDEKGECREGDIVAIVECRPLSRAQGVEARAGRQARRRRSKPRRPRRTDHDPDANDARMPPTTAAPRA